MMKQDTGQLVPLGSYVQVLPMPTLPRPEPEERTKVLQLFRDVFHLSKSFKPSAAARIGTLVVLKYKNQRLWKKYYREDADTELIENEDHLRRHMQTQNFVELTLEEYYPTKQVVWRYDANANDFIILTVRERYEK